MLACSKRRAQLFSFSISSTDPSRSSMSIAGAVCRHSLLVDLTAMPVFMSIRMPVTGHAVAWIHWVFVALATLSTTTPSWRTYHVSGPGHLYSTDRMGDVDTAPAEYPPVADSLFRLFQCWLRTFDRPSSIAQCWPAPSAACHSW